VSALVVQPSPASAFWPFYNNAGAAAPALVPSASTPALVATTNTNPGNDSGVSLATSGDSALMAYGGPAGTLADVVAAPQSDTISVYVVRPGDTLSVIADMFNVSVNTIVWANNLSGPRNVHVGQTLVILPITGVKRVIVKGDTLKSIANKYDADANEIAQFNGLDPESALVVGTTIIIPGGELGTTIPAKKPAVSGGGKAPASSAAPASGGYFTNPLPGARVTQGIHGHNGVDFGSPRGTPIRAAAKGTVIISRNSGWNGGYGNYVVIKHANGTQTLYAHMTNAIVSVGQEVTSGQVIGYVGNTGKSTGTHLHFEVRGAKNPFAR